MRTALRPAPVAVLAALAAAVAGGPAAFSAPARPPSHPPTLLVPARPESVSIESAPAPLLGPGRSNPVDSTARTPAQYAREQFTIGRMMEESGNMLGALLAYGNAVHGDSTFKQAAYRLGLLHAKLGRLDDAERMFREELRRDPGNTDASRELAIVLGQRGKHAEATKRLRDLTVREPARDEHWQALGYAHANAGQLREAETALRRAIAIPPDRAAEHRDLGVVLGRQGRTREARAEYQRALALDPRDPSIWIDLGNLDARAGRLDSALVSYRAAERADSSSTLAYEAQIQTLERLNRPDDIADVYLRWVTAAPNDDELRLRAVRHLAQLSRRDRALEIARDGVRNSDSSAAAHLILGIALDSYGSSREAMVELRTSQSLFRTPRDRQRVAALMDSIRVAAPDSLRAQFAADSAALRRTSP